MSILNLQGSYFSIDSPLRILDRWLNRFHHHERAVINQRDMDIYWTERANTALMARTEPLVIELQLYFSCVVQKRVLFHQQATFETFAVNNRLELAFHPVESAVCDPTEFASMHPVGKDLSQGVAARMVPKRVEIDFRQDEWEGSFSY